MPRTIALALCVSSLFLSLDHTSDIFLGFASTTPLRANNAIRFGNAIKAFTISASVQTNETCKYGPAKMARIYNTR